MPEFKRVYLDEIADYGFPEPEQIMETHGTSLVERGLRLPHDGGDIDLVVSPLNMKFARKKLGWIATGQRKYYSEDLPDCIRFAVSPDGRFDVFAHDFIPEKYILEGRGRVYPDELFASHDARYDQDEATGIWVASLAHVAATKRFTGRPKDKRDLRRIAQYNDYGY